MKAIKTLLTLAVALSAYGFSQSAQAQDRGRGGDRGGDRSEFMKRMVDRFRDRLEVKNDDEWAIISERLIAVMEARFSGFGGRGPGGFGGRGGPRGGGFQGRGGGDRDGGDRGGDRRRGDGDRGRSFGGDPDSPRGKLAAALEKGASAGEIKELLAAYRKERDDSAAEREARLKKARAELREVVTAKQEAWLVLMGMLD